jgi:hypothetical protein
MNRVKNNRVEFLIYFSLIILSILIFISSSYVTVNSAFYEVLLNISSEFFVIALTVFFIRFILFWRPEEESNEINRTLLSDIRSVVKNIFNSIVLGVRYLENSDDVIDELSMLVDDTKDYIFALGGKSSAKEYVNKITSKVEKGNIRYKRILTGDHITHELHKHLSDLFSKKSSFEVVWIESEKYGYFTVSENRVIFAFPSPLAKAFSGIVFIDKNNSIQYMVHFMEIFSKGIKLETNKEVELLCEKCSPNTARHAEKITKRLKK